MAALYLSLLLAGLMTPQSELPSATLDAAISLQRAGRNQEALNALGELLPGLRASSDRAALAVALAAMTDATMALGDYHAALRRGQEAYTVRLQIGQRSEAAWDVNAVGLAQFYLGQYDPAIASYTSALALDRAVGNGDGEITRLNNIGNVHYMRGRYADALCDRDTAA